VDRLKLGEHQLLVVNQIDGLTVENKRAQVCLQRANYFVESTKMKRNLQLYAQSLISGCEHIVVGFRDDNIVNRVETFDFLDEFVQKKKLGNVQECLQFENCLLSWIKAHLPVCIYLYLFI